MPHIHVTDADLTLVLEGGTVSQLFVLAIAEDLRALREATKIYDVGVVAFQPQPHRYLVYVQNRGWTHGYYSKDSPVGWCHTWAFDFVNKPNHGVTRFTELPDYEPWSSACDACEITAQNNQIDRARTKQP